MFQKFISNLSTDELVAYHRDHKKSGIKEVRENVALAARELKRRATKVVAASPDAKVSVKTDTSAMPEMQTETLHEGPHPRSEVRWSIKNIKADRLRPDLDTVPQDFSDDDEAVTEKLSPAVRVIAGEKVWMSYRGMFTVSVAMTPGSKSTVHVKWEPHWTHRHVKDFIRVWGLEVPAIKSASIIKKSKKEGGTYLRIPKRLLPAVMLRLEEL